MAVLADRFLVRHPTPTIDLATGAPVRLDRIACASDAEARAWLDRGARRLAWWHSHLPAWIDVVLAAPRELLVVRDEHARCADSPTGRRCALAWLRAHDVATPLDEAMPERAGGGRTGERRATARALGVELSRPPIVDALLDVIDTSDEPLRCIAIGAGTGTGLSTCLRLLAREVRLRGAWPLAPRSLARHPEVARLTAGRTVVLLQDRAADGEAEALLGSALVALRCAGAAVPLVVMAAHAGGWAPEVMLTIDGDALADRVTLWPSMPPSRRRDLVRRAGGAPGRVVERWLGDGQGASVAEGWRRPPSGPVMLREAGGGWPPRRPASRHADAWRTLERGHAERARRRFEQALAVMRGEALDPCEAIDLLRGAGEAALACGRLAAASRDLDLARTLAAWQGRDGEAIAASAALGMVSLRQGRVDGAASHADARTGGDGGGVPLSDAAVTIAGARAAASGDLAGACRAWAAWTGAGRPWRAQAAALLALARLRLAAGDRLAAHDAWAEAVRAVRRCRAWPLWWEARLMRLALRRAAALGTGQDVRLARDRARLARGDVPPFVRLVARYVAGGARGGRDVAQFVDRWGEAALRGLGTPIRVVSGGETQMIKDLQAILEICRDTDDSRAALVQTCARVRVRLNASAVVLHGAQGGTRLAAAGSERGDSWRIAEHALECGAALPARCAQDGAHVAAAPVRFAGHLLGVVVCRWAVGCTPDGRDADLLLAGAATAMAPHVHAVQDQATRERAAPGDTLGLLGASPVMCGLRERIRRVAAAPFHVLIEGESGSGKELVARALHASGPRRARRFCAVNCAALTDELLEAELFGHARGAFTGAVGDRAGLFEEADGGTLFLDEVGELSLRAQAKLLRVIQDGEVRRVGETFARRAEARIVAATNRTLHEEVAAGRFRADLLYRLDVIRILVPPLRERPDDIVVIAKACWREATERLGSRAQLHPATLAALARYEWPGNVRELQNVMRALAVNAPARGFVRPSALPAALAASGPPVLTLDAARRNFEERFVRAALARAGQRPGQAARDLGVTRQGLRKLMLRLGLEARAGARAAARRSSPGAVDTAAAGYAPRAGEPR